MVVSKNSHAHRTVHCAGRPKKVCHELCVLLCIRAGATVALIQLRGNLTMVRSDSKGETVPLQVSDLRQAFKSGNNPQIVTKKKLPHAATILCSFKPSHAQYHGACLKHGRIHAETPRPLSDVFPLATSQK